MSIESCLKDLRYNLPIYGAAADVKRGAFVKAGVTGETDHGALIKASGSSATPDILGQLQEMLDYSVDGETLIAGTSFVTKPVLLAHSFRIFRLGYDLTSQITATQAVTTTTITLTSLEDDIDSGSLYVAAGTGIGQTNYLTASAAGSATLKAAFTTSLDTSSKLVKILPRFHQLGSLNTDGTMLASQAAAGAIKIVVIDSYIERNNKLEQLNPTRHAALTGLNSLRSIRFWADVAIRDTIPYTVD